MEWIRIEDKKPIESDGLIIVSLKNRFKEIVYIEDGEIMRPWGFDKNDITIATMDNIKYWFKLTEPIELIK